MKILIATFTYHPNVDGVAAAARNMADIFLSAGHDVVVATGPQFVQTENNSPNAANIHRFSISGLPVLGFGFNGETTEYMDFIRLFDPDLIIVHGWDTWPVEVLLPHLSKLRCKSILLSHGYAAHIPPNIRRFPRGFRKWIKLLPHVASLPQQIRSFDQLVFLSSKTDFGRFFDGWVAKMIGFKDIRIIPNSINADFEPDSINFREKIGLGAGTLFLCVANYSTRKNQEMALEAYCEADIPSSSLVFAGSELGEYGRAVLQKWEASKVQHPDLNVRFLEGLSRRDVVSAFRSCDVFVLSATAETQPIVILEAMACAKPFISTDTGCVSELEGGIVVKDVDDMAKQMQTLAAEPDMRHLLGQRGKDYFEKHCSPDATRKAWLDLIEEVVRGENTDS